ncbi:MAG: hypothetical protein ACI9I0_000322 [Rhodoferax sp.]
MQKRNFVVDIKLADDPNAAYTPEVAACLLAALLGTHRDLLQQALDKNDLHPARKVVKVGRHGLERFSDTHQKALQVLVPAPAGLVIAVKAVSPMAARRTSLNVIPNLNDLRDRPCTPAPVCLSQVFLSHSEIAKYTGRYTQAGLILNQGQKGACTEFGLACVVNYLRWRSASMPTEFESDGPCLLFHFARRFDASEGENYDGSSCRGAPKGWCDNRVYEENKWTHVAGNKTLPQPG